MQRLIAGLWALAACSGSGSPEQLVLQASGEGAAIGMDVAVAGDGSAFVAGLFQGTIDLAGCSATAVGEYDALVAKVSAEGECEWLRSFGSDGVDLVESLSVFADGILIAGFFQGQMTVGESELAADGTDAWIARLNSAGDATDVVAIVGPGQQRVRDMFVADGQVYVVGDFEETASVGSSAVTAMADLDGMLWSFGADLEPAWAVSWGGIGSDGGNRLDVRDGVILVSGYFFDSMTLGADVLESVGSWDAFLASVDVAGDPSWAIAVGGPGDDRGIGVAGTGSGSILWTGLYRGPITIAGQDYPNEGSDDAFVARVNGAGEIGEVLTLAGAGLDGIRNVVERDQQLLLTGTFTDTLDMGGNSLSSAGSSDVFTAEVNWAGEASWSQRLGTASTSQPDSLGDAAIELDAVWMTGSFYGELTMSGKDTVLQSSDTDLFLVRMSIPQ